MPTREEKMWQHVRADRTMRQVRRQAKNQPKEERVRRKDWRTTDLSELDNLDDLDLPASERVKPRGEGDRRRANVAAALAEFSGQALTTPVPVVPAAALDSAAVRGTVIEVGSSLCRVDCGGETALCTLHPSLKLAGSGHTNAVAVGDEVLFLPDSGNRGVVQSVLPRRSALVRPDPFYGHLAQVIVANVDQVLVVASWREPAFWPEFTDRCLIGAVRTGLQPIICVNKVDLAQAPSEPEAALRPYQEAGYRVLFTSVRSGLGIAELGQLLAGQTTALAGLSGVGKSSLLSAVQPDLNLRVGEVSARRHEGRHTTTQVMLHRLHDGGFVVDTPGIREFGLSGLRRRDLAGFYPEIAAAATGCRYEDCRHAHEPGCAVKEALRAGRISAMRYDSYRKILATLH